ncbi:DNA-binding transcriptional regulator, AcrR family [Nocardioides scoriae]|uniref:DNA-binding transcriptional regulator, AcrR family n=1 Tax=Nocardioides scoriae TaxID=642780 RepID=A0A1H1RHT9_9ACTN|nr:TetR/AcrR family transcriptional regulator [Nocardioides scoriae]SDS35262.1 DNA-binding transcriptional regulator, AcrR family [Nocardioides scoriae]
MHSVSQSAHHLAAAPGSRRWETARRLTEHARRLALEHGVDGFTLDQLAERAGVSRRTIFNYFPGKDDAVLGTIPAFRDDDVADFVAGGPHGSLVDDLAEIVLRVLREQPERPDEVALGREVMQRNPRLIQLGLQRMHELVESCIGYVEQREGDRFDRARLDVALALVLTCVHVAMDRYLTGEHGEELGPLFTSTLRTAHELLA